LPPCATTGIGSLPHASVEAALRLALAQDVPFLPQLPRAGPSEGMLAAALEGLPGLIVGEGGRCAVDVAAWEAGRGELEERLDDPATLEPGPAGSCCYRPFLEAIAAAGSEVAKVQLTGPLTLGWAVRSADGRELGEIAGLEAQVFKLVQGRAIAMVRAVRAAGAAPIIFFDEPGLVALPALAPLAGLAPLFDALRREGALVGLHCCGQTRWPLVLALAPDFLSIDASLSLTSVLEDRSAWQRFVDGGGALSLGVLPTSGARPLPIEVLERGLAGQAGRSMLTPACGLADSTVAEAEAITAELRRLQGRLCSARSVDSG
jgi:hypothetical protein